MANWRESGASECSVRSHVSPPGWQNRAKTQNLLLSNKSRVAPSTVSTSSDRISGEAVSCGFQSVLAWLPSQYGWRFEEPHRQSAVGSVFGGERTTGLEIPAFVIVVGHDILHCQRRTTVDQIGTLFGDGDVNRRVVNLIFRVLHTIRHSVPFVQRWQELFQPDGSAVSNGK